MKSVVLEKKFIAALLLGTAFLAGCGDDDDFAPVSRNRGYDYALKTTKEFADYPCNEMREGREAVVGRDKDSYYCQFDYRDSVYIWAGYDDTLTATGKEFVRAESSSSSYRSSSSYSSGEYFDPDTDYGTMKDTRDGKTYKTVVVNGQLWMAENLNYSGNNVGTAVCYSDNLNNCDQYGRLYSRDAAMDDSRCKYLSDCDLGNGPIQGICPDGWHIPTVEEMENLVDFIGDNVSRYKSTGSTWNYDGGVDTYGLSFLGAGNWDSDDGFEDLHRYEVTWAYYPNTYQHYLLLGGPSDIVSVVDYKDSEYYSSVRCVKGSMRPVSSSSSYSSSSYRSSSSYSSSSSSYSSPWSSESPSSSFSISSKEDLFNPDLTYGTMTDPRDGKKYKTIEFNGQIWMAENLNFSDSSIVPLLEGHNTCYHEKESECELFGRLYDRIAAMNDPECDYEENCGLGSAPVQGICPDGWHVLTYDEANSMISYVGSTHAEKIISANGWGSYVNGENTYGLSFIAPGTRDGGNYDSKGGYAFYWVYRSSSYIQNYLLIDGEDATLDLSTYNSHELSLPVRCISDTPVATSSSSGSLSSSSRAKQEDAEPYLDEAGTQFNTEIEYGTLKDSRDGKTYKTVDVKGTIWMAENLNYAGNEIGVSTCFNDEDRFCEFFGRLYSRDAAMNSSSCAFDSPCGLGTGTIQGICPEGWHIPTNKEAQDLVNVANGYGVPLMSAKGWATTYNQVVNTYGLSFMGAGNYSTDEGFHSMGLYEHTWVYYPSSSQYYIVIRGLKDESEVWDYDDYEVYNPVRCVKDE